MDKPVRIHRAVFEAIQSEGASGRPFDGFEIYDEMPKFDGLRFPCVIVTKSLDNRVQRYIGGGELRGMAINVQIAFMEKFTANDDEGNPQLMDQLARTYRQALDALFDAFSFPIECNVAEFEHNTVLRSPEGNSQVWGAEATLVLTYGDD